MPVNEHYNKVFDKYYKNAFLPSLFGGDPSTSVFKLLFSLQLLFEQLERGVEERIDWAAPASWFSSRLPLLIGVERFDSESDREYFERIVLQGELTNSADDIKRLVEFFLGEAVEKVEISTKSTGVGYWGDLGNPSTFDAFWSAGYTWSDETSSLRAVFVVRVFFRYSGSNTDPLTYEYWSQSEHYTIIEELVKLFKPPGANFELELVAP